MEPKVNVTVNGNELTILTGKAPDPLNDKPFAIEGNINAVYDYLHHRIIKSLEDAQFGPGNYQVDTSKAIIKFDTNAQSITLHTHEHAPINTTVVGTLRVNPLFAEWGINAGVEHTPESLAKIIRMNRYFFPSSEGQNPLNIIQNLQNLKININTEIEKEQDANGNRKNSIVKKVADNNLPKTLYIKAPVYVGEEPIEIEIEVLVDTVDTRVKLFLESPQLNEALQTGLDNVFARYRADFVKRGFVCITQ